MRRYSVIYVDAFTRTPYAGNPCAVLPEASGLSDAEMQAIAREANLSETSFVLPSEAADFRVRYFTPRSELPFAGHPTIATAWALAEEGRIALREPLTTITFEFNIGVLPVDIVVEQGKPVRVVMTQRKPEFGKAFSIEETAPGLGLAPTDLRSDCTPQVVGTGVPFLLAAASGLPALRSATVQREILSDLCRRSGVAAVFLFCLGGYGEHADTHARLLDPHGSSEDPYTGSAAGAMAAYVVHYGLAEGPSFLAEQGHILGRPGEGVLEIVGRREDIESVRVSGAAVRTLEGAFLLS